MVKNRLKKYVLTFCKSSFDAAIPNIKEAPPNTSAVATAKAFPTTRKRNNNNNNNNNNNRN